MIKNKWIKIESTVVPLKTVVDYYSPLIAAAVEDTNPARIAAAFKGLSKTYKDIQELECVLHQTILKQENDAAANTIKRKELAYLRVLYRELEAYPQLQMCIKVHTGKDLPRWMIDKLNVSSKNMTDYDLDKLDLWLKFDADYYNAMGKQTYTAFQKAVYRHVVTL